MPYQIPPQFRPNLNRWFVLFASLHPTDADWANWTAAGSPRLMITLDMTRGENGRAFVAECVRRGIEAYIRINEWDIYHRPAGELRVELMALKSSGLIIVGVFLGNEWENGLNWNYGSPDWGQAYTWYVRSSLFPLVRILKGKDAGGRDIPGLGAVPFPVLAGGWTGQRSISEDEPPVPGMITARDIMRDPLWEMDGFGGHVYEYGWSEPGSPIDPVRAKFWAKWLLTLFHMGPMYIDEFGADHGDQLERGRAAVRAAAMFRVHPVFSMHVRMFCPFVFTGDPFVRNERGEILKDGAGRDRVQWDPRYLMTDRRIYDMFGAFVRDGIVPD